MAKSNQSSNAQSALDKFKMEAAAEVGVNLKSGYNGDLTSREAGSIGGQMVKNICPERLSHFTRECRRLPGHTAHYIYLASLSIN